MPDDERVSIRFLVCISGLDVHRIPGEVVDLPRAEAALWADGERAEYVDSPRIRAGVEIETTEAPRAPRRASGRRG